MMSVEDALREMQDSQDALHAAGSISQPGGPAQPWSESLVTFLSVSVLAFTALALLLSAILLWKREGKSHEVLKTMGVISIVGLSALLLITGYSKDQLTPIVGLFGAIAGYLLGRETT